MFYTIKSTIFIYQINFYEEILWLRKLKILCRGHMLLMILIERNGWNFLRKRNARKQIKKNQNWKSNKEKSDKLYVKWKGYNSPINNWIDKKRHRHNCTKNELFH